MSGEVGSTLNNAWINDVIAHALTMYTHTHTHTHTNAADPLDLTYFVLYVCMYVLILELRLPVHLPAFFTIIATYCT